MSKRTLYDCLHACVLDRRIRCRRGYLLSLKSGDGGLDVKRLAAGEPLALNICQLCGDFESMGPPVPEAERGWLDGNRPMKQRTTAGYTPREAVLPGRR
jgi:hypothetical protein